MACKKYTITNTGSTATIYFEYRRCGDALQMDQVPLNYNQTKNIWFLDGTFEIDLHIEELIDDASGMDNSSMIQYQLNYFNKCLDEARNRKLWKFIAIHGVGKGVLRNEIRQLIKQEGLKFQDASYQRYGYGATEVLMR
jgi:hypothetical protein